MRDVTSSHAEPAMTKNKATANDAMLAIAAAIAFAAAIFVAARPETQAVTFAMPMSVQPGGVRR